MNKLIEKINDLQPHKDEVIKGNTSYIEGYADAINDVLGLVKNLTLPIVVFSEAEVCEAEYCEKIGGLSIFYDPCKDCPLNKEQT